MVDKYQEGIRSFSENRLDEAMESFSKILKDINLPPEKKINILKNVITILKLKKRSIPKEVKNEYIDLSFKLDEKQNIWQFLKQDNVKGVNRTNFDLLINYLQSKKKTVENDKVLTSLYRYLFIKGNHSRLESYLEQKNDIDSLRFYYAALIKQKKYHELDSKIVEISDKNKFLNHFLEILAEYPAPITFLQKSSARAFQVLLEQCVVSRQAIVKLLILLSLKNDDSQTFFNQYIEELEKRGKSFKRLLSIIKKKKVEVFVKIESYLKKSDLLKEQISSGLIISEKLKGLEDKYLSLAKEKRFDDHTILEVQKKIKNIDPHHAFANLPAEKVEKEDEVKNKEVSKHFFLEVFETSTLPKDKLKRIYQDMFLVLYSESADLAGEYLELIRNKLPDHQDNINYLQVKVLKSQGDFVEALLIIDVLIGKYSINSSKGLSLLRERIELLNKLERYTEAQALTYKFKSFQNKRLEKSVEKDK